MVLGRKSRQISGSKVLIRKILWNKDLVTTRWLKKSKPDEIAFFSRLLGGCGKTHYVAGRVTSAAKAGYENKPLIAAVNRCATQNQRQPRISQQGLLEVRFFFNR
jgi:hypothetical protein